MQVTIRIDGNKDYEYAKETVTLIDGVIYIVDGDVGFENVGRFSLHLLNRPYIEYAEKVYSSNYKELLELIFDNYFDVVMAIKHCVKTGRKMEYIAGVEGLTVSDY